MKKSILRKLKKSGLQKAIIECPDLSDLHFHYGIRTRIHRKIGKILQCEIDSGRQQKKVLAEASAFLKKNFPGIRGFSKSNLWKMKNMYNKYKNNPELERISDEIPVSHNSVIASFCKTADERRIVLTYAAFNRMLSKRKLENMLRSCRKNGELDCSVFCASLDENAANNDGIFSFPRDIVFDIPEKEFGRESVKSLILKKIPDAKVRKIRSGFVRIHVRTE